MTSVVSAALCIEGRSDLDIYYWAFHRVPGKAFGIELTLLYVYELPFRMEKRNIIAILGANQIIAVRKSGLIPVSLPGFISCMVLALLMLSIVL